MLGKFRSPKRKIGDEADKQMSRQHHLCVLCLSLPLVQDWIFCSYRLLSSPWDNLLVSAFSSFKIVSTPFHHTSGPGLLSTSPQHNGLQSTWTYSSYAVHSAWGHRNNKIYLLLVRLAHTEHVLLTCTKLKRRTKRKWAMMLQALFLCPLKRGEVPRLFKTCTGTACFVDATVLVQRSDVPWRQFLKVTGWRD